MSAALAVLPPESLAMIERVRATASHCAQIVDVLPLETVEAEATARALLRTLEALETESENERKRIKDPHLRRSQEIDRAFKDPRSALERVSGILRRRIGDAVVRREAERTAALRAVAEATREGDHETANAAALAVATPVALADTGVTERMTWEAVSFNVHAMPVEYLTVDVSRVRDHIKAAVRDGREPAIPGVTFERRADLRVTKL